MTSARRRDRLLGIGQQLVSVVIVDDTPDIRLLLRVSLRRHGSFAVIGEAGDGQGGVELARSLKPDVVLLDLAMPVMDGLHALPLIREASPDSVVVVLSGFEGEQLGPTAIAAGAAAYVQKGASPSEIIEIIAGCLGADFDGDIPAPAPSTGDASVPSSIAQTVPLRPEPDEAKPPTADLASGVSPPSPPPASTSSQRPDSPLAGSGFGAADFPAASDERFRLLVEQGVDIGLAALDDDGRVQSWNDPARRITGLSAEQVLGRHFGLLYGLDSNTDVVSAPFELLSEAAAQGRAVHCTWLVGPAGSQVWGEVTLTALSEHGSGAGFALSIRDESTQRRLDEAQASMFAAVSHDMRTPIIAIRAFASLLRDAEPQARAEFADRIDSNASQVERLVAGLFDYAKVRAGVVPIVLEPLRLAVLARECVDNLGSALAGFDVVVIESDLIALADPSAMTRVLDNVLTNASKYSPPGSRIEIAVVARGDRVELTVHDEGRGIASEDLEHIFGEFVRGRLAENDGGTGLGLASVRQLMTLQGGAARIESQVGNGTSVTVELRRA